ncbi:hypothetical protein BsWGS_25042 [Bradybaena similaris]
MGRSATTPEENDRSTACTSPGALIQFEELKKHNKRNDQWLLIDGKAYNVTEFAKTHPGGAKILHHYAGEDATDAWTAFHNDKEKVSKYMKSLYVGEVKDAPTSEVTEDFRKLRQLVEERGWLRTQSWFHVWHFLQVVLLEVLAVTLLWYCGVTWTTTVIAIVLLTISQSLAGFAKHDSAHHSVFPDLRRSHLLHHFVGGLLKGTSSHWWNFKHFQHHAKPNVIKKDPDISLSWVFLIGDKLPVEFGKKKLGFMPYQWQHVYFFFLLPPLLVPVYFHLEILYFCLKRKKWLELALMLCFCSRLLYTYTPFFGLWGTFAFYMAVRVLESHWFTWISQMSHLPNEIVKDNKELEWFHMQLQASCNVEPGWFNDWFTGHLNYQIEHHLFPTMSRANLHKVAPLVQSLCEKHGIEYRNKTLMTGFIDVVRMLKRSGKLWYDAYYER